MYLLPMLGNSYSLGKEMDTAVSDHQKKDFFDEPTGVKCALAKHALRTRNARNLFLAGSACGYLRRV